MLSSLAIAVSLGLNAVAAPERFDTQTIQSAHARITPSIALLRYSIELTNPSTGEQSRRDRDALALIVSPEGLAITHGHMVLENAEPFNISVTVGSELSERTYDAELVGKPDDVNIAFISIDAEPGTRFPHVEFDTRPGLELGQPIVAFGVMGETMDYARALQEARVSAVLTEPRVTYALEENLRFGFIGGPVIDTLGRIVGVTGYDLSRAEGGELYVRSGQPLLYQASLFQRYIADPDQMRVRLPEQDEAWLGVFTQPLGDDFAEYWGLERRGGLIVSTVVPGSPAHSVLQPGDIITVFNGVPIRARFDRDVLGFTKLVREAGAGKPVPIEFLRDGTAQSATILLGTRPRTSQDAAEYEDHTLGITVRELTTDVRIALNLSAEVQGVIVRRVRSGSVAQQGKVVPGTILITMGGVPVTDITSYQAAIEKVEEEKPAELVLFGRVGAAQGFFRLEPRW